ncbi:MAG: methyltransferase domain-containing protein [Thermoplasmata archaeon]|nr:methyltransferase domain-containing protein [Thermoplasmata archaeon]MCI4361754.1 methyltransferase domain-containing protein [Thermoplasmata archaeon]
MEHRHRDAGGRWSRLLDALGAAGRTREATEVLRLLGGGSGQRLLDVGGRTGAFTVRLTGAAKTVVVAEPEVPVVRVASRRYPELRFVAGVGEHLPFAARSFDRVTAIRSTHHMDDPEAFFREAGRVLVPGGRIVIEELAPASGFARVFSLFARRRHRHGLDLRGPDSWRTALRGVGFEDVQATTQGRWYFVWARTATRP